MLRILLAESDQLVCDTIAACLEELCAADVVCADTSSAAVEVMNGSRLDVAVVEPDLPGMSGFELAACAADRNVPVLLIPGHPDAILMCRHYGYPYLPKPMLPTTLAEETLGIIRRAKENVERVRVSGEQLKATCSDLGDAIRTARRLLRNPSPTASQLATSPAHALPDRDRQTTRQASPEGCIALPDGARVVGGPPAWESAHGSAA